ncbi:MAG: hypothetical protein ACYC7F_10560, partial [Gemmatimonadaceae bacterium]
ALALGGTPPEISDRLRHALEARAPRVHAGDLVRMLTMLIELEPHFRRSSQQQLLFETLLVRFALLDRTLDLESVLKGVMANPSGAPQGAPAFGGPSTPERPAPVRAEGRRDEPTR